MEKNEKFIEIVQKSLNNAKEFANEKAIPAIKKGTEATKNAITDVSNKVTEKVKNSITEEQMLDILNTLYIKKKN